MCALLAQSFSRAPAPSQCRSVESNHGNLHRRAPQAMQIGRLHSDRHSVRFKPYRTWLRRVLLVPPMRHRRLSLRSIRLGSPAGRKPACGSPTIVAPSPGRLWRPSDSEGPSLRPVTTPLLLRPVVRSRVNPGSATSFLPNGLIHAAGHEGVRPVANRAGSGWISRSTMPRTQIPIRTTVSVVALVFSYEERDRTDPRRSTC